MNPLLGELALFRSRNPVDFENWMTSYRLKRDWDLLNKAFAADPLRLPEADLP